MSPAEMLIANVISRKGLDREVILALEDFGMFEFIDIARRDTELEKSREEKTVYEAIDRIEAIVEYLDLDPRSMVGEPISIDESDIDELLEFVREVVHTIEPKIKQIDEKLEKAELELSQERIEQEEISALDQLGIDVDMLGEKEFTYTTVGTLSTHGVSQIRWNLQNLTDDAFLLSTIPSGEGKLVCSITVPVEHKEVMERILRVTGFRPLWKELITGEWGKKVLAAREILLAETERIEAKRFFIYTENAAKVWGWIPARSKNDLQSLLEDYITSDFKISFNKADPEAFDVPTYLDNPEFMQSTEGLVTAYDTPSQHDIDPTKVMFFSFPIIFGLVFADVGQGFLVLLIGVAAWWTKKKDMDLGDVFGYLQTGRFGLITMGIFSMLGGLLFGSVFGAETVIKPLWPIFSHYIDGEPNPYRSIHMLKLSIEVGALHLLLGILLHVYKHIKNRDYRSIMASFSFAWTYFGFINLLFGVSYSDVAAWFSESGTANLWIPFIGIGYGIGDNGVYPALSVSPMIFSLVSLFLPFSLMAIASIIGGMESIVHLMECGLAMISHTISYARIFAFNTVHVILSGVFFSLMPSIIQIPIPPLTLFGIELVPEFFVHEGHHVAPHIPLLGAMVGTFIVGLLEGLLAFMHTLRLHYVEWFSKFYHGGGTPFTPFSFERRHSVSTLGSIGS